jgi:uncharacterized repeat protein (TIGR02543 family)
MKMRKYRGVAILLIVAMLLALMPTTVFAVNNYEDGLVTIDENFVAGELPTIIGTDLGIADPTTITGLIISSAVGELNADDIAYINSMTNITVLDVADNIVCGNVGDDFMNTNTALYTAVFPATGFGNMCFYQCDHLTSLSVPNATTAGSYFGGWCWDLESVNAPLLQSLGMCCFGDCDSLSSIELPAATTFTADAFVGIDNNDITITLPSVTDFGITALRMCNKVILVMSGLPPIVSDEFGTYDAEALGSIVAVPEALMITYDNADGIDGMWYGFTIVKSTNTVTFDSNDGSSVDSQTITYNGLATEPADPTKEGLTFSGWYIDEEFNIPYDFSTSVTTDLTLYAKWTCTITYNGNGETSGAPPEDDTQYQEGMNAFACGRGTLEKTGYTFTGWNTQADGKGTHCDVTDDIIMNGNITFYADWKINSYDMTYVAGEHGSFENEESLYIIEKVDYLNSPVDVPTVVADEGYEFIGWQKQIAYLGSLSTSKDEYIYYTTAEVEAMEITDNYEFTAVYEALEQCAVTFNSDGGSTVSSQTLYEGQKVTEPTEPTKSGYIFKGWYSDQRTTNLWDFESDTVAEDMTLYADWIVDNSGDGGSITPDNPDTQKGNITLTLKDSNGNPLAYYHVELYSTIVTGTTDANGQVTFSNVTLENHELVVFDQEGAQLGTIILNMSEADNNKTTVNGNDVAITFNESAVSIDIEISVEDGSLVINDIEINTNPKTGATETALYIGEGSEQVNVLPYLSIVLTVLLISSVLLLKKHHEQQ